MRGRPRADETDREPPARFIALVRAAPLIDIELFWLPSPPVFPGEKGWG